MRAVLSIAGSDPSGGAGVQADLKTFSALGCYGMAAMTSLTAQNTQGVQGVHFVPPEFIAQQIASIFEDIDVAAVKIGMLGDAAAVHAVADALKRYKPAFIVLDPVMVATSGDRLVSHETVDAIFKHLVPLADIVTPNIPEAEVLMHKSVLDLRKGAIDLYNYLEGPAVLLKGGHLKGAVAQDILVTNDEGIHVFELPRAQTRCDVHGTGCTLSSALAAYLAHGMGLADATQAAKDYVHGAIVAGQDLRLGHGADILQHFYKREGLH